MSTMRTDESRDDGDERIVFLGPAVPRDSVDRFVEADPRQVQAYKLAWSTVTGIEETGRVVDLISIAATDHYPRSGLFWCAYRKWDRSNGSSNHLVPFINILGLKHLTQFIGCLTLLIWWSIRHHRQKRYVLLYGLVSSQLYAVLCMRWLLSAKASVIITDLPGLITTRERWWRRVLRPIDRALIHHGIRAMDGLIVLTAQIAEDCAPNVPAIVVEGVVSDETEELAKTLHEASSRPGEFVILYGGALQRRYGIPTLLDAFANLPDEDFRLWLLGSGEMEEEIRRRADKDPRICLMGSLPSRDAFRTFSQATVLINPRPSNESFVPYSFPSKLLDYMASGRPVVTTRLAGIPCGYDPHVIWLDQETPEDLTELLVRLRASPAEELDRLGQRARDYVLREKNLRRQGKRILEFLLKQDALA